MCPHVDLVNVHEHQVKSEKSQFIGDHVDADLQVTLCDNVLVTNAMLSQRANGVTWDYP